MSENTILKTYIVSLGKESHRLIYTKDLWRKIFNSEYYLKLKENNTPTVFFLVNPELILSGSLDITNALGVIRDVDIERGVVTIDILNTPLGNAISILLDAGVNFSLFPAGRGIIEPYKDKQIILCEDYELYCFELIQIKR